MTDDYIHYVSVQTKNKHEKPDYFGFVSGKKIYEEEFTEKEYAALSQRFFEFLYERRGLIMDGFQQEFPEENVAETSVKVDELLATSVDLDERAALEKLKRAFDLALKTRRRIVFENCYAYYPAELDEVDEP